MHSYRGKSDLALETGNIPRIELIAELESSIGTYQTGYKNGELLLSEHTDVWVAEDGYTITKEELY